MRQKGITRAKIAEKEAAEAAKMQAALERESESPSERKRRELAEQMQQDLENATALFGDSSVSENAKNGLAGNSNPLEAGGANPRTKAQFYALSEALAKHITDAHGSKPLYADFVEHFARQLCLPLKDLDVKKVSSTLAALGNEKQRLQKEAQGVGKKKGGAKGKPQLGTVSGTGGGAKTAVMAGGRGYAADLDSHDVAMDDYDDDFVSICFGIFSFLCAV